MIGTKGERPEQIVVVESPEEAEQLDTGGKPLAVISQTTLSLDDVASTVAVLEPETGVLLQNRGSLYVLDPNHPQVVAPGKRPFHTLSPVMALRGGEFAFTLGTPGGDSQPQTILQVVNNHLLFGMTPQQAIEAPRFRAEGGVALEHRVPLSVRTQLAGLGHDLRGIEG